MSEQISLSIYGEGPDGYGCADVGTIKFEGYTLISNEALAQLKAGVMPPAPQDINEAPTYPCAPEEFYALIRKVRKSLLSATEPSPDQRYAIDYVCGSLENAVHALFIKKSEER